MKAIRFRGYAERQDGYRITVEVAGSVEEYAKAFLAIYNNAREYTDSIASVENCYDNRIFVTVYENAKERAVDWLAQFGEVKRVEACNIFAVCAEYPDSKQFFDDDREAVFVVEID